MLASQQEMQKLALVTVFLASFAIATALQWPPYATQAYPWFGPSQNPPSEKITYLCQKPSGRESVYVAGLVSNLAGSASFAYFGSTLFAVDTSMNKTWTFSGGLSTIPRTTPVLASDSTVIMTANPMSPQVEFKSLFLQNGQSNPSFQLPNLVFQQDPVNIKLVSDGNSFVVTGTSGSIAQLFVGNSWNVISQGNGAQNSIPATYDPARPMVYHASKNQVTAYSSNIPMWTFNWVMASESATGPVVPLSNDVLLVPFMEPSVFSDTSIVALTTGGTLLWNVKASGNVKLVYQPQSNCVAVIGKTSASCISPSNGQVVWKTNFNLNSTCQAANALVDNAGNLFVQFSAEWKKNCPTAVVAMDYSSGNIKYTVPAPQNYNAGEITMNNRGLVVSLYYYVDSSALTCLMGVAA